VKVRTIHWSIYTALFFLNFHDSFSLPFHFPSPNFDNAAFQMRQSALILP